jgi:UTP--glucose-1-phosphate uridylyltransferase
MGVHETGMASELERLMREDGQPELAIEAFAAAYEALVAGGTGLLPEAEITPVAALPEVEALHGHLERGERELGRLVVVKLNGGLGTSMGMERAKSLLMVKDGRTFLDLIAEQVVHLRKTLGVGLPLVLMDSFRTQADSLARLALHPGLAGQHVPFSFLQHRVPKVAAQSLGPVAQQAGELGDPDLAWCPPGHGDIYLALQTSGLLEALRGAGYRWAFVSNSDNLGAVPDKDAQAILGWMAAGGHPFVMECTRRTAADRKGGHLAASPTGGLLLREVAQCSSEDLDAFQDIERHRYFNTNNLWVDLDAVAALVQARGGALGLPVIRNKKPLDPAASSGLGQTPVYQLETAMGAAISIFEGAAAVSVPRRRFAPVKTTNDLLVLRSDFYARGDDGLLTARRPEPPLVDLDPAHFKLIDDFEARVNAAPSLAEATHLVVRGDVRFGAGVVVRGQVEVRHAGPPLELADTTLGPA